MILRFTIEIGIFIDILKLHRNYLHFIIVSVTFFLSAGQGFLNALVISQFQV